MIFNHPFFHFRPRKVPALTIRFNHTWGLGGAALVLILMLLSSGIILKFAYDPFPGRAYDSIIAFQNQALFGRLIRNIHHWSANFLVGVVFLHMLRVFFTGAFLPPRQLNWLFGLLLFTACLASNFTGYLLPWDQLSYWAITICTSMLAYIPVIGPWVQQVVIGGQEIGPATLRIFYSFHTAVLPACLILLSSLHFWYVRRAGGVVMPRQPKQPPIGKSSEKIDGSELLMKELVASLVVIAVIFLVSTLLDAPLGDKANPGLSPNPAKAPWYFAGLQELLLLVHPVLAILIIPVLVCGALVRLPYQRAVSDRSGIWFRSQKGRRLAVISLALALVITPAIIGYLDFLAGSSIDSGIASILPASLGFVALTVYYALLRARFSVEKDEAVQAVFIVLLVSFVGLTLSGIWFRGAGMALVWPWNL